jgi:hypothetical protein
MQPRPGKLMPLQLPLASQVIRVSQVDPQSVSSGTWAQVPVAGSQMRQLPNSGLPQSTGTIVRASHVPSKQR